jgi:hypothetical protein
MDTRAGKPSRPLSFATWGQGIALGSGAVGFPTFPDDRQRWFIVTGPSGRKVRAFFIWLLTAMLALERWWPGAFFWLGAPRRGRSEITGAVGSGGRDART